MIENKFVSLPTYLQIEMKGIININDIHKSGSESPDPEEIIGELMIQDIFISKNEKYDLHLLFRS